MIIYKDNSYRLNLIKDNHVIVSSENLGESINQAYFKIYKGYLVFYNQIEYDVYDYDYALVSDKDSTTDEFTSLNSKELDEILDDGKEKSRAIAKAKYELMKNKIGLRR